MLKVYEKTVIFNLLAAGFSIGEIAKRTGKSYGTVYRYKRNHEQAKKLASDTTFIPKKILPHKDFIDRQIKSGIVNSAKIYRQIQSRGYRGSYVLLNTYIKNNSFKQNGYKRSRRVETAPGEQAQVDWGSFGKIKIGERVERLYAFVYILSYSRALYVEFVVRQNQKTFQACHIHAFEKLGIPKTIRYDNVKTVVLSREKLVDGSKRDHLNPMFVDFAQYYGFQPELCPPYWPRSKGKVESSVKYLRNNFMIGERFQKTFKTLDELNEKVMVWLERVAQQRVHRTTNEKPVDRWRKEKEALRFPENLPAYNINPFSVRRSTKDGLVQYKSNHYSVPSRFAQKQLYIREMQHYGLPFLEIYYQGFLAATHQVSLERGKWVIDDRHELEEKPKGKRRNSVKKKYNKRWNVVVATRDPSYYDVIIPR